MMKMRFALAAPILLGLGLALLVWGTADQTGVLAMAPDVEVPPPDNDVPTDTIELLDGCLTIGFLGSEENTDGTSTWRYSVAEQGDGPECKDLSNWMVELPDCAPIVDAFPEPWEYVHPDPNFQLWGIKWETGDGFEQGEFEVRVEGQWPAGETSVAAKAGTGIDIGSLVGPFCVSTPLQGQKTVTPTQAGPGDTLSYTIVVSNPGPGDVPGVRIMDPIPGGTVYVWDSAHASSGDVDQGTDAIKWTGDLTESHAVTLAFQVYVDHDVPPGSAVNNRATVITPSGDRFELTATTLILPVEPRPWTVLVYLAADNNIDNEHDRLVYDYELFNNLEQAAARNPGVRILVEWDRSPDHAHDKPDDHTRRYLVLPDRNPSRLAHYKEGETTWDLGELNMGDDQTLYDFVAWARSAFAPTSYTLLSLVGHGGGWSPSSVPPAGTAFLGSGVSWDDTDGDHLGTREIGDALYEATEEGSDPIDILFLDASMMGMLENAYEVRDSTLFLVASESTVWAKFPYEGYLGAIEMDTEPRDLAEQMVRIYDASLAGYPRTMGALAVDVAAITPVSQALDNLALTLSETLTAATRLQILQAYSDVQKFDSNWDYALAPPDAYVDLYDLAAKLAENLSGTLMFSATEALQEAIGLVGGDVVVEERHHDGHPWLEPSQTWTFTGAHGLAIYFPVAEDSWIRGYYQPTELDLAADTAWDDFIHLGWYEGKPAPALPTGTLQLAGNPLPIDPAQRPGLLPVERFWFNLPLTTK